MTSETKKPCAHCVERPAVGAIQEFIPRALAEEATALLGRPINPGWRTYPPQCQQHLRDHFQLMMEDVPLEHIRVIGIDEYKKIKELVD